jgi:hypothetical protein
MEIRLGNFFFFKIQNFKIIILLFFSVFSAGSLHSCIFCYDIDKNIHEKIC